MARKKMLDAEVVLKPAGDSASESRGASRAAAGCQSVSAALEAMGFEVLVANDRSISIRGPQNVFQKALDAAAAELDSDESLPIPAAIRPGVEGIYVQKPPTFF